MKYNLHAANIEGEATGINASVCLSLPLWTETVYHLCKLIFF